MKIRTSALIISALYKSEISSGSWVKNTDPKSQLLPSALDLQPISPTSENSQMQIVAFSLEHTGTLVR